jgi:hypothetical protein
MTRQTDLIARAQTKLAAMFGAWGSGDIYRSPAEAGGKVGARTLVSSGVSGWRRPATEDPRMAKLMPILNTPVARARISFILKLGAGVDIRVGDQWRESGVSYAVEGVAAFHTATLCALSEIKGSA